MLHYIKKKVGTRTRYNTRHTHITQKFTFALVKYKRRPPHNTPKSDTNYLAKGQSRGLNLELPLLSIAYIPPWP
jgi:hypothetical protein